MGELKDWQEGFNILAELDERLNRIIAKKIKEEALRIDREITECDIPEPFRKAFEGDNKWMN